MNKTIFIFLGFFINLLFAGENLPTYSLKDSKKTPIDWKLVDLFDKKDGVFIEVGAYDGILQSNTLLLEQHFGWEGILVEANPYLVSKIKKNRPTAHVFSCALGTFAQNNTYVLGDFSKNSLMCSIDGTRLNSTPNCKVLIRSLQSILEELKISHIDFFSLDTEGYEYNILNGIDFDKTTFNYLLIEIYSWDYEKIVSLLDKNGYCLVNNFSNYNKSDNPHWDGTHNDYLFKRNSL